MKKIVILEKSLLLILLIIALISLSQLTINAKTILDSKDEYSYTKAICDSKNNCEDYVIKCEKSTIKSFTPTGQIIKHDENWVDKRDDSEKLCD